MLKLLMTLSNLEIFLVFSIFFILISIAAILIVERYIPRVIRYRDNPVIGNVSALISIIYGVLVGLTALYLINNNGYTADAVQREANATANLYRDSKWLQQPTQKNIQTQIKNYLEEVIKVEWPAMEKGTAINNKGDLIIDSITNELHLYHATVHPDRLILHDMLEDIKGLYDARAKRIYMSLSELDSEMWLVIIIGTILTVVINYLFGMEFYMHVLTVSAVALMAASMLFLLVTLDRPFQGESIIEPNALRYVLTYMQNQNTTVTNYTNSIDSKSKP